MQKKIRYYFWFIKSYVVKYYLYILLGFLISFFGIFIYMSIFPSIYTYLYHEKEVRGFVGQYRLEGLPEGVLSLISSTLVVDDHKGEALPMLSSFWEVSEDAKTYTFHLKQNELWDDNKLFDANDIKTSFRGIEKKVLDDYTIQYVLPQPLSLFPFYLTKPLIRYPLIGINGAYRVDSYKLKDGYLTELDLNPDARNLPYKTYKYYESEDKLISAYKRGRINVFDTYKKNVADIFSSWKNSKVSKNVDLSRMVTIFFNTSDKSVFKERDIRRAFVYSIPSFDDSGTKAISPLLPGSWAFNKELRQYNQDIDKAREIMPLDKESTESMNISLYTFYDYLDVAEKLKSSAEEIGFSVAVHVVSYIPDTFDILLTSWDPPSDPDQYYYWHSTQTQGNITHFNNPRIDKILEDGRKTFNKEDRKDIYFNFQKVFMEELPAYFLYYPYKYSVSRK